MTYRESGYSVSDLVPDLIRPEFDKLAEKAKLFDRPDLMLKDVEALADQATDNYRRAKGLSGPEIFQTNIRVWRGPDNERLAPNTVKVALRSETLATFLEATKEINAGKAGPLPLKTVLTTGELLQWAVHEKTPSQLVWDYNTYQKPSAEPPQERVIRLSPHAIVAVMDGYERLAKEGRTGFTGEQLISAGLSTHTNESLVTAYDQYLTPQREWNPKRFGIEPKSAAVSQEVPQKGVAPALVQNQEPTLVKSPSLPSPLPLTKDEIRAITAKRLDALGAPDQVTEKFRAYKNRQPDQAAHLGTLTTGDLIERIKNTEAKVIDTLPTDQRKEQVENRLSAYLDSLPKAKLVEEVILSQLRLDHFSAAVTGEASRTTNPVAEVKDAEGKTASAEEPKKKENEKPLTFAEKTKATVQRMMESAAKKARPTPSQGQELER